jgi:hypothetical protein
MVLTPESMIVSEYISKTHRWLRILDACSYQKWAKSQIDFVQELLRPIHEGKDVINSAAHRNDANLEDTIGDFALHY